jgi:hypothetical protein
METNKLHPDLERRVAELEIEANQGSGFTAADWLWLLILGVVGPVVILFWGWAS